MHQSNSLVNSWYCQWIYLDENKSIAMQWTAIALVRQRPKKNEMAKFQMSKQGKT
jgi:hypothetical protein